MPYIEIADDEPQEHPHEYDENGNVIMQPMKDVPAE